MTARSHTSHGPFPTPSQYHPKTIQLELTLIFISALVLILLFILVLILHFPI